MKEKNNMIVIHIIFLILLTLIVFRNLLLNGGYLAGMDAFGFYADASTHSTNFFDIWNEASTGQPLTPILNNFLQPLNTFIDVVSLINVLLILVFLLTGVSMYLLSFHLFKNRWIALISAIIYMLNIWILGQWARGHFRHVVGYSIISFCYLFFEKYLNNKEGKYLLVLAILFSILVLCGLDVFFIFMTAFVIYTGFILSFNKNRFSTYQLIIKTLIIIVLLFFLTIYIFLPLYTVGSPRIKTFYSENVIKGFSHDLFNTFVGNTLELSYLAWVGHTDWNTHPILPYWLYKLFQTILPILSLSVLLFMPFRRDIRVYALILSAIVSIFLAKSLHPPFGEFYKFLLERVPLFHSLSVPNRYAMNIWFVYSLLSPLTLFKIYERMKSLRMKSIGIALVSVLLIFGLSGGYSIFKLGFQTWKPPENEIKPHLWLVNYSQHLIDDKEKYARIITVPYGQERMFVEDGWIQHDLGYKSTIFNERSIFSYLVKSKIPYPFYQYTEYLIREEKTRKLSKILGIYDVKYIVIQGYPWAQPAHRIFGGKYKFNYKQHNFFENLEGLNLIYVGSSKNYTINAYPTFTKIMAKDIKPPQMIKIHANRPQKIYENLYWIPRIFAPKGQILVIGGLESFLKLAEIESFNFSNWNLIFADHLVENMCEKALLEQINRADYIAFVNSEPLDLAMLLANATWIKVKSFEKNSAGWEEDDWPIIEGFFVYSRDVISAKEKRAEAIYKVEINNDSNYEIWVRAFLHNKGGKLKIIVDKELINEIDAYNSLALGFKWIKVGEIKLDKGTHTIEILNINGENKLNGIVIAKNGEIVDILNYTKQLIQNKAIYLLDVGKLEKIGLDTLKLFKEEVIFDDYWISNGWVPSFPENIKVGDSGNKISGITSLRIDVTPRPKPGEVVGKRFYELQDWSGIKYISFWFKGTGEGEPFNIWIYFNNSKWPNTDAVRFGPFYDNSEEWRRIVIPVDKPAATYGKIMWNKVSRIVLAIPDKNFKGTIYLDKFSIYKGDVDRTKLERKLNAEVLLFKDSKPIENYIIQPKSKNNVTYIEFKKIRPSKWIVKVNSTAPYALVFSNSYHQMWRAYVNGKEYKSIPSYYFINSFQINETGEHEVVIEFIGQRIQNIALIISALTFIGCIAYIFYDWRREKGDRWAKEIERKVKNVLKRYRLKS